MIDKAFQGRYTSSSFGTEAKVYAKSVDLRYTDTGRTVRYNVTKFKNQLPIRWEARIVPHNYFQDNSKKIDFTIFKPFGQEEEQTAIEWPDPPVGKLVMVEKYTGKDDMTLVIFVLAAILLFVILFNK